MPSTKIIEKIKLLKKKLKKQDQLEKKSKMNLKVRDPEIFTCMFEECFKEKVTND